jgi:Zn-dependent peptidase ImmA (M78 family)/transcriptional regulator with XRE-family HTH domain
MTMKVNPEMIVLARELRGVTQTALAEALSINQATISRYEHGSIEVPPDHLKAVAHFLERPISFFFWTERLYGASCVYHRKNRKISAAQMKMIDAKVNLLRMQASRLLQQARVTAHYSFHRLDPEKHGGPAGCAKELRRLWQLPSGPVRNVVRTIEAAGGMVFRCPFGMARVDGISQWPLDSPEMPPVFFVHEDAPGDRERWSLCHEIGHVVMHHLPAAGDPEEEANLFASEFLMPADDISHYLDNMTLQKAAALKSYWSVSMQAIIVRACQSRRISKNQYSYLFRQISARGYRKCEPVPIPPEDPAMFSELLAFHRTSLGRSDEELADHIGELPDRFRATYGRNLSGFRLVGSA